jgi:lysophospholipase L1-like esterase
MPLFLSQIAPVAKPNRLRLIAILLLGAGLLAGGFGYRHFWYARPIGIGPAGPVVPSEPFEHPWTTHKVLLVGLGDSMTAGFGVPATHSYFARLAKNPDDEVADMRGRCLSAVLPRLETRNLAVSGTTSPEHLEKAERLEKQPPDVFGLVVMTTGGNDLIHSYGRMAPREGAMYGATLDQARPWIEAFRRRLGTILDRVEAAFPGGCLILLGDIYDPTDGVGDISRTGLPAWPDAPAVHGAYNDVIHSVAASRSSVCLVPIQAEFLGHGIHCTQFWSEHYRSDDPTYWYAANLEDPSDRGYDALRRLFLLEILKVRDRFPRADGRPHPKSPR